LIEAAEGKAGGVGSAHAVDAAAGWGGGGAEVDIRRGGAVLAAGGTEDELAKIICAADNVAADQ